MNCIIIEDEKKAAQHLEYMLQQTGKRIAVQAKIDSVKNAVQWLKANQADLIFLDVHLGDNLSFSIFDEVQVNTPVIFTTAYDEYAIKAFKLNSIAYLLKPVDEDDLREALDKLYSLRDNPVDYRKVLATDYPYQKRFLVSSGNNIKILAVEDIAYFHMQNKHLFITSMKGEQYMFDGTLEYLVQKLDPEKFFRINRQYIISIASISNMLTLSKGRVLIETITNQKADMNIIVSIDRANEFKKWLNH